MENDKKSKILPTILLVVILIILIALGINFFIFRKKVIQYTVGHFEIRDGVETFVASGQVVINSLVEVDGKLYYVDDKGHKVKDTWAIINNDGDYGYFGSLGDLVKDKIRNIDGKLYYFNQDGILYIDRTNQEIITIEGIEYIANANGELRSAKEPETTMPTTTVKTPQTTVAQVVQAEVAPVTQVAPTTTIAQGAAAIVYTNPPFANAINIAASTTAAAIVEGPGAGIVAPAYTEETTITTTGEVKIVKTEKVEDTIDGDEYECTVTLLKPIMSGATSDETSAINASIDEIMDAWFEDVNAVVDNYVTFPKSVTFTSATLGTVKKASIIINISGSIKPKSGSSKAIKYRITYDRESESAELTRTSTN